MKIENLGKGMTVAGALLVLYAMMIMPVAMKGSDIVNIHLISERQNTMIIGGMLFLAGIVLFAVFKMKQTKEESDLQEELQLERIGKAKEMAGDTLQSTVSGAAVITKTAIEKINSGELSKAIRVCAGILSGCYVGYAIIDIVSEYLWLYTSNFIQWYGEISIYLAAIVVATLYAFRKISTLKVLVHLVCAAVLLTMAFSAIEYRMRLAKIKECEEATFVTRRCSDILYR